MDRKEITTKIVKGMIAYQDQVTVFAKNTAIYGWIRAIATVLAEIWHYFNQSKRQAFLSTASGTQLDSYAAEYGFLRDQNLHATTICVFRPVTTTITSITAGSGYVDINVSDGSEISASDTITIRELYGDPPDSETQSVYSKPSENTIRISGTLTHSYAQGDLILVKKTIGEGTRLLSTEGAVFETLEEVITGTANSLLTGENVNFSLADKCYVRAVDKGDSGNVSLGAISKFETEIEGISSVTNILPASGGGDQEDDFILKSKVFNRISSLNNETDIFFLALAQEAHRDVIRAYTDISSTLNTVDIYLVHRQGVTFSSNELAHIKASIEEKVKSGITVNPLNMSFTSVEISAKISLLRGYTLNDIYPTAASQYANFVDYRTWEWGKDVDDADLLSILNGITGVGNVEDFTPDADVSVSEQSLPRFVSLRLENLNNPDEVVFMELDQSY